MEEVKELAELVKEDIVEEILEDNKSFSRECHVFDPDFFRFTLNAFRINGSQGNGPLSCNIARLAVKFCFHTLARSFDKKEIFHEYLSYVKTLLQNNEEASRWFLHGYVCQEQMITTYALQCRSQVVIDGFTDLVVHVLKILKEKDGDNLMIKRADGNLNESAEVVWKWISELDQAAKYWVRFRRYFWVLKEWCEMGVYQRTFFLRVGVFA
eukprot:UN27368